MRHLGGERGRAVVPRRELLTRRREPVRLVVGDRERFADPHDEVDAAGQVAAHARAQRRIVEPLGVTGERIASARAERPRSRPA